MYDAVGIRDSQPGDSPGNLENMPCGLAVITLAQREARPQPICWGEQPSPSSLRVFHLLFSDRLRPPPPEETSEAQQKKQEFLKNINKTLLRLWKGKSTMGFFKGKVRNQTASEGLSVI